MQYANPKLIGSKIIDCVPLTGPAGEVVQGYITARRLSGSFRVGALDGREITGGKSYKKLTLLKPCRSNYQCQVNSLACLD